MILGVGATGLALQGFGPNSLGTEEKGPDPSLMTRTPMEGRELAIKLSRRSLTAIRTDSRTQEKFRSDHATDTAQLIAVEFQIIAAANNYWK